MKILWLNHRCIRNPMNGGAERTIFEVGRRLVSRGHNVDLLTGGWRNAPRHETIEGIKIHRYGSKVSPHLIQPLYLRYHKDADVIVDDMAHAAPWFSPWFSSKPGVVFFRHMHARTLKGQASPLVSAVLSFLERHYSFIYKTWPFVTESVSSEKDLSLLGIDYGRITKIPPGVDTELFRPRTKSELPSLVYFGGMRSYKRPEHALHALRLLRRSNQNVHLTIVGDGPSLPKLRQLSYQLGLDNNVTFTGKVSDERLSEIVASSWVNLHCSMSEGWGYSMTEAAAAGTPTVAYRVPGVSDTIIEGQNGLLVEDGNIHSFASAIARVINADKSISMTSRLSAMKYSWENATDLWESKLTDLAQID